MGNIRKELGKNIFIGKARGMIYKYIENRYIFVIPSGVEESLPDLRFLHCVPADRDFGRNDRRGRTAVRPYAGMTNKRASHPQ